MWWYMRTRVSTGHHVQTSRKKVMEGEGLNIHWKLTQSKGLYPSSTETLSPKSWGHKKGCISEFPLKQLKLDFQPPHYLLGREIHSQSFSAMTVVILYNKRCLQLSVFKLNWRPSIPVALASGSMLEAQIYSFVQTSFGHPLKSSHLSGYHHIKVHD